MAPEGPDRMTARNGWLWQTAKRLGGTMRSRGRGNAESALMAACLRWLEIHRDLVPRAWRANAGQAWFVSTKQDPSNPARAIRVPTRPAQLAPPGCPDIIGFLRDGRFLGVECKLAGSHPNDDQRVFLGAIATTGAVALVVHTVEELEDDIKRNLS